MTVICMCLFLCVFDSFAAAFRTRYSLQSTCSFEFSCNLGLHINSLIHLCRFDTDGWVLTTDCRVKDELVGVRNCHFVYRYELGISDARRQRYLWQQRHF